MSTLRGLFVAAVLLLALGVAVLSAGPNRYGHSDRVERHMLPAVSTGPQDPAWSPDGAWIAFSMRGDIWKVPAAGGEAIALTQGPAYHFEPAWSPDGTQIALSFDASGGPDGTSERGNLDIGVVDANGGPVRRITNDPEVDVQPEWTRDGRALLFVSARGRGFQIYRHDLDTGVDSPLVNGMQPAVSPDGRTLAYVGSVGGRAGTGGIWVMDLPVGEPRLVHYEEAEYRTKPAWMPNGSNLLYVSDESRANDIAVVPLSGGNPIHLTVDSMHEYSPSPNPTGDRFAFVSNRSGPTVLYTVAAGGGPFPSWTEVPLTSRRARIETGTLRISVQDDGGGAAMPARVHVLASDGRAYTPDGSYHRVIAATETHYFHTPGASELEVPAGRVRVEALRGHEYVPGQAEVAVPAGGVAEVTLTLARLIDLPALGIYSGDTHIHDLHQGRFGLTHEQFYGQLLAEDLHVTNALIHMDGTRLMGRWGDLTGAPHRLSTRTHILQYGEEYRGSLGHIAMLGIERYILPLIGGAGGTAFGQPELEFPYLDGAREQGGIAGFVHPYLGSVARPTALSNSLIPLDVALGRGDFYDVVALYSDEFNSTEIYYRLLNCGFRIAATGGTDNFSDVWRDPPPGTDRTYVRIDGPLSLDAWMQGIRDQRTFGSTGPILLLDVEGREPGDEIALADDTPTSLLVRAEAVSIAPMDRLEIIVNGQIARTVEASDSLHIEFDGTVEVPVGGWIAARASGPSSRYVTDSYAFAQTSPVYIVRDGRRFVSAVDARFFIEAIDALWARVADADWRTAEERERFNAAVEAAREVYESIEAEAQARADRSEG